jgi:acyl carrier protein
LQDVNKQLDATAFLGVLRNYLRQVGDGDTLTMESNLYELGLDSMAAVNLLLELEETYQVIFPEALLTESTFETPLALKSAIVSLV